MDVARHGSDLEDQAQRLLRGAKQVALEKVVPGSIDRARELAERLGTRRYLDQVQNLERDFSTRAKQLERKLEKRAKRLPVDTPFDRRRRRRSRRRAASGTLVLVGLGGAAAGLAWWIQRQQVSPAEQPPERRDEHAASPGAPASDDYVPDGERSVSASTR
jgi:ferric-dicitrate binding protein FerR (iron transport regulator)